MHADWIEHRRADDRERLGWIRPDGDGWAAIDVLGREVVAGVDWVAAEEALESRGLRFLAEPWGLRLPDGRVQRVRITRLAPDGITVVEDDWGAASAVGAQATAHDLPFPAPDSLQPLTG